MRARRRAEVSFQSNAVPSTIPNPLIDLTPINEFRSSNIEVNEVQVEEPVTEPIAVAEPTPRVTGRPIFATANIEVEQWLQSVGVQDEQIQVLRTNASQLASHIHNNSLYENRNQPPQSQPRRMVCRFCSAPVTATTSTEIRGRRACSACFASYTDTCANGCGNILVESGARIEHDPAYTAVAFASPQVINPTISRRVQYRERWYCGCRVLPPTYWRCNGGCHRFYDNSVAPAVIMMNGHRKCNLCFANQRTLMNRELPYNANVLDYLTPYPKGKSSELQYGVEIEVQHKSSHQEKINLVRSLLPDFVICKFDRSVTRRMETEGVYGFEIVSVPATIEDHKTQWPKLLDSKHGLYSWKHGDCGMHVHITRKALSPLQIGRMLQFVNSPYNAELIAVVADRWSNNYCKILDKKLTDAHRLFRDGGRLYHELVSTNHDDRYEALNLTNRNTVELRIFRGNLKKESFFKNLEFTDALVHFCKDCSIANLRTNPFLEFVSKRASQYPNLIKFLIRKGFNIQHSQKPSKNYSDIEEKLAAKAKTDPRYVEFLAAFKKSREVEKETVFSAL